MVYIGEGGGNGQVFPTRLYIARLMSVGPECDRIGIGA